MNVAGNRIGSHGGVPQARIYSYTIYPSWFGGDEQAALGVGELAARAARHTGWIVADISITPDGADERGVRMKARVEYQVPAH